MRNTGSFGDISQRRNLAIVLQIISKDFEFNSEYLRGSLIMCRRAFLAALFLLPYDATAFASCITKPPANFVLKGDLATDRKSGLVWKRCAIGMQWDEAKKRCTGEPGTFNQAAARKAADAARHGWHVPTGEELETLLVASCSGPKINARAFPNVEASDYGEGAQFWTSTKALPGMFYIFDFTSGDADMHSAEYGLSVLLVKKTLANR